MQYNTYAAGREALIVEADGERFRFYFDRRHPETLHITLQHGTSPEDAIWAFFEGEAFWKTLTRALKL